MWPIIIGGIVELTKGWFEVRKSKQQAEAAYNQQALQGEIDYDLEAMKASRDSWKDEIITGIWFAPLVVGWFSPERAKEWISFVAEMPYWYQFGMFGIMAATFGLRWYFKNQNFRIAKDKKK